MPDIAWSLGAEKALLIEALRIENAAMRAALNEIIRQDQRERRKCIEANSAGNTYAVTMVDGPCAEIARRALMGKRAPTTEHESQ